MDDSPCVEEEESRVVVGSMLHQPRKRLFIIVYGGMSKRASRQTAGELWFVSFFEDIRGVLVFPLSCFLQGEMSTRFLALLGCLAIAFVMTFCVFFLFFFFLFRRKTEKTTHKKSHN